MTIVTSSSRKRPAKAAQAAKIQVARIVQHTPRGRAWKLSPDPEAKARAVEFFAKMGVKRPDEGSIREDARRRKTEPALASHAASGLPFIVQRNGFAIVALK